MKHAVVILLVLTAGCGVDSSQRLTPAVADGSDLVVWTARVESAIKHWQAAIGPDCTFPLAVGTDGAPVVLVSSLAGHRGLTTTGSDQLDLVRVQVLDQGDPLELHGVLMHELGHATGLVHEADPRSIMFPRSTVIAPSAADVARMRAALGCEGRP